MIPTIITQALGRREIQLGNLAPTRDLNFVADTVSGMLAVGSAQDVLGEVVNLGTGREISVGDLAKTICEIVGCEAAIRSDAERQRPGESEVDRLCADASKAKRLASWQPAHTLRQGLSETIDWFRGNLARFRIGEYAK